MPGACRVDVKRHKKMFIFIDFSRWNFSCNNGTKWAILIGILAGLHRVQKKSIGLLTFSSSKKTCEEAKKRQHKVYIPPAYLNRQI